MAVALLLMATGCSGIAAKPTEIEVRVFVKTCPDGPDSCYELRVPRADVLARALDSQDEPLTTVADDAGVAVFKVDVVGSYEVEVRSFVYKTGVVTARLSVRAAERTIVKVIDDMVEGT